MIDRLRTFLNRPLRDGERPRLFFAAVVVIGLVAGALALLDDRASTSRAPGHASQRLAPVPEPETAVLPESASLQVPSEEGQPRAALDASRSDVAAAKRAARRFLAGYLRYTYGRGSATGIASVSAKLRDRLASDRPRVPPHERRRRAHVLLVQANGVSRRRAAVTGLVDDGARRYTVPLELARRADGWTVTEVRG